MGMSPTKTQRSGKKLWGELYMDADGKPHFHCHTPGTTTFDEARDGLKLFIELLQSKVDRQGECPFNEKAQQAGQGQEHRRTDVQAVSD